MFNGWLCCMHFNTSLIKRKKKKKPIAKAKATNKTKSVNIKTPKQLLARENSFKRKLYYFQREMLE